ncbi:long-chain-fatty-acid-CoA ligase [Cutibacterium acnes JCM 18909]|nr:long-chain-fatty-acid-CoA ligase [Cutibacterium acnes JCM 18909]
MANCPYLSNAVVLGEGHKYAVALLTLDRDALMTWGKRHGKADASYAELTADHACGAVFSGTSIGLIRGLNAGRPSRNLPFLTTT